MLMPTSSEFVALCQSQVSLLTQGLGAALSAIYLTEELVEGENPKLIPVVVHPETAGGGEAASKAQEQRLREVEQMGREALPRSLAPSSRSLGAGALAQEELGSSAWGLTVSDRDEKSLIRQRQIVLPLIHEGVMMGLLVTGRDDRPWNEPERRAIERIANTIAIACLIDQRRAWSEQQLSLQRQLDNQQRDLLDDLLHQFRNPLTALRTFSKLLIRRLLPGDANRDVATGIVRETDRLQELLQQFEQAIELSTPRDIPIALKSVQSLSQTPEPRSVPLLPYGDVASQTNQLCIIAEVLEQILNSAEAIAQERNLELTSEIQSRQAVKVNPKALREVLSNLIDNALKYTPAGGKVLIQVGKELHSPTGNWQGIAVTDNGSGIPKQDLAHLFERHYRGVQAESNIPGTGLGLAIARDLVEQMGGKIEVFSPARPNWLNDQEQSPLQRSMPSPVEGKGTTFVVWLPLAQSIGLRTED